MLSHLLVQCPLRGESLVLVVLPVQVMPGLSFLPQSSLAGIVELVVVVLSVVDAPVANTT
jgi:hypothetical protein